MGNKVTIGEKFFTLRGKGNCKTNNVIYLFICILCKKGYVGKTDTPLHVRTNKHRNPGKVKENTKFPQHDYHALSRHAVLHNVPFDECYRLYIVENVHNPDFLVPREGFFVDFFGTKEPFGLNIDNPLPITSSRLTNAP